MQGGVRWKWALIAIFATSILVIFGNTASPLSTEYRRRPGLLFPTFHNAQVVEEPSDGRGSSQSQVDLIALIGRFGHFNRVRYRFSNVQLSSDDTLTVFLDPKIPLPVDSNKTFSVDLLHPGRAKAKLPTAFVYTHKIKYDNHTLFVKYKHAAEGAATECQRWEERAVYLLQIPFSDNMWHQFNDGLMGAFSTLREEGQLPLAEIDDEGNMREITADLEATGNACPYVFELRNKVPRQLETCTRRTAANETLCDVERDAWCTNDGFVVAGRKGGPILLRAKGVPPFGNKLNHFYQAISSDIRPWEQMVGTCFRTFYAGKSNTLDFYNIFYEAEMHEGMAAAIASRDQRLKAFRRLMLHAERSHRSALRHKGAPAWKGYADKGLEVLRRGVGVDNIDALETLRKRRQEGISEMVQRADDSGMAGRDAALLRSALSASRKKLAGIVAGLKKASAGGASPPSAPGRQLRPVVTFMWRKELRRCILNEADLLEYILRRYNVSVRVTTFLEPMLETMQLMGETDVLLGVHGAGWVNGIFLKEKGAAMQMFPYGWAANGTAKNLIRGGAYQAIVRAKGALYRPFVNLRPNNAYFRALDIKKEQKHGKSFESSLHPKPEWPWPASFSPGSHWIYQNTVIDLDDWVPVLDDLMTAAGIPGYDS